MMQTICYILKIEVKFWILNVAIDSILFNDNNTTVQQLL